MAFMVKIIDTDYNEHIHMVYDEEQILVSEENNGKYHAAYEMDREVTAEDVENYILDESPSLRDIGIDIEDYLGEIDVDRYFSSIEDDKYAIKELVELLGV